MRADRLLLTLLLLAPPAHALGGCAYEGDARVCWSDTGDTLVEQDTPAGRAAVETYSASRDGTDDGTYAVERTGATATVGGASADAHLAEYEYRQGDRTVEGLEVRATHAETSVAAGYRRATWGAVVLCEAYAADAAQAVPCIPGVP